jgi:hypothetical protein
MNGGDDVDKGFHFHVFCCIPLQPQALTTVITINSHLKRMAGQLVELEGDVKGVHCIGILSMASI